MRPRQANLLGQIILWAAIGLAIVVLVGPLAVLLFFAALGFIVWLAVRSAYLGKARAWEHTRVLGKKLAVVVAAMACWGGAQLAALAEQTARSTYGRGGRFAGRALSMARQHVRFLGTMVLETLGGAGVGCLLGYVIANGTEALRPALIIGAIAGTCLGFLVGISRYEPAAGSSLRS